MIGRSRGAATDHWILIGGARCLSSPIRLLLCLVGSLPYPFSRRWVGAAVPGLACSPLNSCFEFDAPLVDLLHFSRLCKATVGRLHTGVFFIFCPSICRSDSLTRPWPWWADRLGRLPGSRAVNSNTWWKSARWPSAGTRLRAPWTWAWATPASSRGGIWRYSPPATTAPAAEIFTWGVSVKTGCL